MVSSACEVDWPLKEVLLLGMLTVTSKSLPLHPHTTSIYCRHASSVTELETERHKSKVDAFVSTTKITVQPPLATPTYIGLTVTVRRAVRIAAVACRLYTLDAPYKSKRNPSLEE